MRRTLAWGGIVLGVVYLVILGGSWDGIYFSGLRIASVAVAGSALALWAAHARRSPRWRPRSALVPAIVASIGSLAISTVFSRAPRISLEYLGYSILLASLYLLLVRLFADPFFRRRLASLASLLFVGISGLFIVLVIAHWISWWQAIGHLAVPPLRPEFEGLTYGNPSAVLTIVTLLAMPTAANVRGSLPVRTAASIVIIGVVGLVALMSGSRAGWLALGLTSLIVPIGWLLRPMNRHNMRAAFASALARPRIRVLIGAIAIVVLAAAVLLAPTVIRRASEGGTDLRVSYLAVSLRIFGLSPLVGTGPGTWVIERLGQTQPAEADSYIPHAHNLEAQTLAELGLVGAAAGLLLVVLVVRLVRHSATGADSDTRRWAWAAGIGLVYFVLHQLLDFYANMPAILFAAAFPIAYIDAMATMQRDTRRGTTDGSVARFRRLARAAIPLLLAVTVVRLLAQELPALRQEQAATAADRGDWSAASEPADQAAADDPEIGTYEFTAGLAAAHEGDHSRAVGFFQAVVARTDFPEGWLNLAAEQWDLGQSEEATASLTRALRLGIQRPAVAMPAGDLALRAGQEGVAIDAFSAAIAVFPSLAGDPWWNAEASRAALFSKVVDAAIAKAPGDLQWEIALEAGQANRAATLAQTARDPELAGLLIHAWSGDEASAREVFAQCAALPLDLGRTEWCGRLAARRGDLARANVFRNEAETIIGGGYAFASELRVNKGRPTGRIEGLPASLWGTFTYRRTTPMDILVPSLVHLTIE